ncbi:Signal transduction histidine kinase [Acetoanaerobium noterae]|uniref:histidine kinase n=1 Tax=Acetoanaerobium noterae TaxID=745369 RepID=A0A1T5D159_9FIRM|nr:HAMP domain-containing sensor histidine kinase [Acetoanaerobium noterae]SKB65321.1 Signal transduction histidine kinase [Acetoanaerobium noterae]
MKMVALSDVFKKKYTIYLSITISLLVMWFVGFTKIIRYIEKYYEGKGLEDKDVYFHASHILIVFENQNSATSVGIAVALSFIVLIGLLWLFTFIYSKYTSKKLEESLSYLKILTQKIRNEDYNFYDYQEDITEFAQVKEAFSIMANKINEEINKTQASEKIRKNLILDISHDLKNPLMSIDGYIDMMLSETKDYNQKRYLEIIKENSSRANNLVMNLFELAKLESAEYSLERSKVDFSELLKNVLIENLRELELKGLTTELEIPDEEILILGNEMELRRAFYNILDNVMKYHQEGAVFKVSCKRKDAFVDILFSNRSKIELKNLHMLTEPFTRLKGSENLSSQGAGLGLSIVRKIIEAHSGSIYCLSHEEGEFIISIRLPCL